MKRFIIATAMFLLLHVPGTAQFVQPHAGAVERTVNAKMADVVSVRDFCSAPCANITDALNAISKLGSKNLQVVLPEGDLNLTETVTFTDKNLRLIGAGVGVTRVICSATSICLNFLSTSMLSSGFSRLHVSDLTFERSDNLIPGSSGIGIQARWNYTKIVSSHDHAAFENVNFSGSPKSSWMVGIKLIDGGRIRFSNVSIDNGGAQTSDARAGVEIERLNATNITGFEFVNSFFYGTNAAIRLTHATAPAGTIEGIYIINQESVGLRHIIYDDNERTGDKTRKVNGVAYTGGHASISYSAFTFGWVSNLILNGNQFTFSNNADRSAALEAGIVARTSAQNISVTGGFYLVGSGGASRKPFLLLPTDADTRFIILSGIMVGGFGSIVDQVGTPSTSASHIYIDPSVQVSNSVFTSTTGSGYRLRNPSAAGTIAASATLPIALNPNTGTISLTTVPVALGGTGADLSATGGASQVLQQSTPGGRITVGPLPGLSVTKTVRASGGKSDCTLIFNGGLLTDSTC